MKNKVILTIAMPVVMAIALSGILVTPAFAQTATTTSTTTSSLNASIGSINSEVTQLVNIRGDESIPSDTKINEEILDQQTILNQIITLSTSEISAVQTQLNALPTFATDTKEYSLQSNYLAELSSYNEYFTQESAVVTNASTLSQLQTVAASIKNFRDSGYNNEIYNMVTFALLYYDQGIITTANSHLNGISSNLTNLENDDLLSNPSALDTEVAQAASLISEASTLQGQANLLILIMQPSLGASASSTATSTTSSTINPTASSTASSTPVLTTTDPRTLVDESIGDIKSAYQIFIEVADNIKSQLSQ